MLFNPADAVFQGEVVFPSNRFCQNGCNEFGQCHTLPVWISAQQLQQLRIDLDVELGPGQRPQSAVPQAIGASLPGVKYLGEPAYLIVTAQGNVGQA